MAKPKFPGLKNMTPDEVRVMKAVCEKDGCDTQKTLELITCIDDCFSALQSVVTINSCQVKQRDRKILRDAIDARIMRAKI